MSEQLRALRTGLDFVVATPGRLCDHIDRKSIVLQSIALIVLDEADEMLDKGFAEDLDRILSQLPPERQIGLFSATLPPRMEALANKHMRTPVRIHLTKSHQTTQQQPNITQISYLVESGFKQAALARILHMEEPASAIVFCHTRDEVDQLVHHLSQRGIGCAALHGGLSQPQRDKVLQRFRKGHLPLLVATDVAARGLDVDHVSHVINYAIPGSFETYVHRIGRTGRAGRKGVALTLLSPRERRWPLMLKRACGAELAMQAIPTSSQLRERRLSNAKARIEQLLAETCEPSLQLVAEQLTTSPEEARWAAVALQLAQAQLSGKEDFVDIPLVSADQGKYRNDGPYPSNGGPRRGGGYGGGGGGGGSRRSFGGNAYGGYNRSSSKDGWQNRGERGRPSRPGSESSSEQGASGHGQEPTRRWSKEQPPAYGAGPSKRRKTGGPFVANSTPERGGKGGKSFARPGSKPRSSERPSERTVRH